MQVKINGRASEIEPGTTIATLVSQFKLQPKFVAVELNRNLVPRRTFDETPVSEGDEIEIVTLVGGG